MREKIITAAVSAVMSGTIGWAAGALTLTGRVAAIEGAVLRIEQRLDAYVVGRK